MTLDDDALTQNKYISKSFFQDKLNKYQNLNHVTNRL